MAPTTTSDDPRTSTGAGSDEPREGVRLQLTGIAHRWGAVALAALLVRLAYWVVVNPHWVPVADADQYVQLARSLAHGHGYGLVFPQMEHHPTAFRPPVLPVVLTPGAWLFGNALWPARLLMSLIGTLVVVLGGAFTARIGGRRAGLIAAAVLCVYPPLLANDTVTLTEPIAAALLLGGLLALDSDRWAIAGLCAGLLLLTRPNSYLVVVVIAVWALVRIDWRRAAGVFGIAALVLVPWLVRNQVQVHTFRPVTSDGFTLAAIYAPQAQAAGKFIDPVFSHTYDDPKYRLAQFDEAEWNRVLTTLAIDGVKDHPGYVLTTLRNNLDGYFELDTSLNRWPEWNDGRIWRFRQASLPLFYVVTVAGLVGVVRFRRDPRVVALGLIVLQFSVLSLLLVAPPRLRAPLDLMCCIGVGLLFVRPRRRAGDDPDVAPAEVPTDP